MAPASRTGRADGGWLWHHGRMRAELLTQNGDRLEAQALRIIGERNENGQRVLIMAARGEPMPVTELRGRARDSGDPVPV